MSSTPVVPKPVVPVQAPSAPTATLGSEIRAIEKKIGVWLDPAHIVLLTAFLVAAFFGAYVFQSGRVEVAQAKAAASTEALKVAQQAQASSAVQNAAQQEQSKEVEAAMSAANSQLALANTQLAAANKQLAVQLASQQKIDATLNPTQQSARWQQLVPASAVTPTPTGFAIDGAGGLATIQALEELPIDRTAIANDEKTIANLSATVANDAIALDSEKKAHVSDIVNDGKTLAESKAETKKVSDDFGAYKKKARRNYLRAFGLGFILGVFGAHAAGV